MKKISIPPGYHHNGILVLEILNPEASPYLRSYKVKYDCCGNIAILKYTTVAGRAYKTGSLCTDCARRASRAKAEATKKRRAGKQFEQPAQPPISEVMKFAMSGRWR